MNLTFSPMISRLLAIVLCVLVVVSIGLVVAWPFGELRAIEDEIDIARERLAAFQQRSQERDELAQQRDQLQNVDQVAGQTLAGGTPALAGAQLQRIITAAIEDLGARLTSTQALPVEQESQLQKISLRVQMLSDIATLSNIIYRLESQKPFIFIKNLYVRANNDSFAQKQADKAVNLTVTFEVYAFAEGPTG